MMGKNRQRGQSTVMYVVSVMASMGTLGLVVDVGYATYRRHVAQAAAEAAAIGGIGYVVASNGCNVTCGSGGVVCNATPQQCPNPLPSSPTTSVQDACLWANTNGFAVTTGGRQNVTVATGTGTPPTLSGILTANSPYWMTVRVSEQIPQTFSAVLGNRYANVSARATAITQNGGTTSGCVYILDPSGSSVTFSGSTPKMTSGCGIYVNSSSSSAILSSGSNQIITNNGAKTWVVGGITAGGTLTITPNAQVKGTCTSGVYSCTTASVTPTADPFATWFSQQTAPSSSPCTSASPVLSGTSTQALSPGCYSSAWVLSGNSYVTLSSGVYVLKGGISNSSSGPTSGAEQGISVDGTAGVMIYMLGGGISQSGSGAIVLNPTTSGTWRGVSFWQPSTNTSAEAFSGTTSQYSTGLIYAPKSTLTYSGGSGTSQTTLVVNDVVFSGTSYINNPANTSGGGGCTNLSLVE